MKREKLLSGFHFLAVAKMAEIIPTPTIQPILDKIMEKMLINHGDAFELLEDYDEPVFLISPTDFPFVFRFKPYGLDSFLTAHKKHETNLQADATIKGSSAKLLDLMEGRVDGDALFFSREITISGNTEAVVALRNAIENAEINFLDEILASCKPLKIMKDKINTKTGNLTERAINDFSNIRDFIISPAMEKIASLEEQINIIKNKNEQE